MVYGAGLGFAAAVLVATSTAASLDHLVKRGAFSLQQIEVQTDRPFMAPVKARQAYLKYNVPVPAGLEAAAETQIEQYQNGTGAFAKGTGTAPVWPVSGDVEYLLNVTVGNHQLALDLDTGSSDLWVFSTLQPTAQRSNRPVQRVYDPEGSNAVKVAGHTWQIRYGDMSGANGNVYKDTVTIAGITVPNQAVEAASTVSKAFITDTANDGLLGFAFSKLNTIKPSPQKTWFENARPLLAQPLFTATLKRQAIGTYDFGFIDKSKYKGEINWVDVNPERGFWLFNPTAITVGDGTAIPIKINAIADTGTSLWYLPRAATEQYWGKVPGSAFNQARGGYTFPCKEKLPDLHLTINNKRISVSGINMKYQQMNKDTCFGGLQRDTGMPFSIFGDVFFKSVFTVFEMKEGSNPRLGFAQQANEEAPLKDRIPQTGR